MINNTTLIALSGLSITLIVITVVLLAAVITLYIVGKRAEKKQADQERVMEENSQLISLYVLDKKKLRLKEAGLPSIVLEQAPKYAKRAKVPIVKVKAGPRVMNLIADAKVYETILPKQEIKAKVSGIYITSFKRIRGPVYEPTKKKKFFGRNK